MKKALIVLFALLIITTPVFAKKQQNEEYISPLKQYVQENRLTDITPEYIDEISNYVDDENWGKRCDSALEAAQYFINLNKEYYGIDSVQTAYAYLKRGELYYWYAMPDKYKQDIDNANEIAKKYPSDKELEKKLLEAYMQFYSYDEETLTAYKYAKKIANLNIKKTKAEKYLEMSNLASMIGDADNSLKYYQMYVNSLPKSETDTPENQFRVYLKLALMYKARGKFLTACEYLKKAEDLLDKADDEYHNKRIELNFFKTEFYQEYDQIDKIKETLDENNRLGIREGQKLTGTETQYMFYYKDMADFKNFTKYEKIQREGYKNLPEGSLNPILLNEPRIGILIRINDLKGATELTNETLVGLEPYKEYIPCMYAKFVKPHIEIQQRRKNPILVKEYLDEVYELYKNADTEESPWMVDLNVRYGDYYSWQDKPDEAIKYYNKALEMAEKYGMERDISRIYTSLAHQYAVKGDKNNAFYYVDGAIEIVKSGYGEYSSLTYDKIFNKYYVLNKLKMYDEAAQLLADIEAQEPKIYGSIKNFRYNLYSQKSWKAYSLKDYETALSYAAQAMENTYGYWEKDSVNYLYYRIYKAMGDDKNAKKHKKLANL